MSVEPSRAYRQLFDEIELCKSYLIGKNFAQDLDFVISESQPLNADFFGQFEYIDDFHRCCISEPMRSLEIVETHSPVLLCRDLAAIGLLRTGNDTNDRRDRVSGMIVFTEDFPEKTFEAALSLCHWRYWGQKPSRWLHWESFFEVIDLGLKHPEYSIWSAYAFVWALYQNGSELRRSDPDYNELMEHFSDLLNSGAQSLDPELSIACNIAMGRLRDTASASTLRDVLGTKYLSGMQDVKLT